MPRSAGLFHFNGPIATFWEEMKLHPLGQDISHEAWAIADEILDAIKIPTQDRNEIRNKIKDRIERLAQAILVEADKQPGRCGP
jgi:hypothetical protein